MDYSKVKRIRALIIQKIKDNKTALQVIKDKIAAKKKEKSVITAYRVTTKGNGAMAALDKKLETQEKDLDKDVKALEGDQNTTETDIKEKEEAKVEYDETDKVEKELDEETTKQNKEEDAVVEIQTEIVTAEKEEVVAETELDEEDKADINIAVKEEEVKEKKIKAEENAANATNVKNKLNTYYKTIVKKLEGTKFDGSQDFQILAKINTKATNGTIFAHAFPSKWGAKWESGGKDGQGKMLFIRGGKLAFDIGWTGYVGGKTIINDGKDHKIGI
jgi:chromosome segregation ATPase